MVQFVFKKLLKNPGKTMSILVGVIFAVAVVMCVPLYSTGILQRVLVKNLESYQQKNDSYAGYYAVSYDMSKQDAADRASVFAGLEKNALATPDYLKVPILSSGAAINIGQFYINGVKTSSNGRRYVGMFAMDGLEDNITVKSGKAAVSGGQGGVYNVMVSESFAFSGNCKAGDTFTLATGSGQSQKTINVRISGIITPKDNGNAYWYVKTAQLDNCFIFTYRDMHALVSSGTLSGEMTDVTWFYAIDYHRFNPLSLQRVVEGYERQKKDIIAMLGNNYVLFPAKDVFTEYYGRISGLTISLIGVVAPVLFMLFYFIYMMAGIKIGSELNEISLMQSRGAKLKFIVKAYLLEAAVIAAVSFAAGLPLAFFICRMIGLCNGFLEFVSRSALMLSMTPAVFAAAFAVLFFFLAIYIIPVLRNAGVSIVKQKHESTRHRKKPLWKRMFLDFALLLLSLLALYAANELKNVMLTTRQKPEVYNLNLILFLVSAVFIVGAGLLFLRIFPLLMKLIYRIGRRFCSASFYAAMHQVICTETNGAGFFILFLILTVSTGIFSANSARTINRHIEDSLFVGVGADLRLTPDWDALKTGNVTSSGTGSGSTSSSSGNVVETYAEPDLNSYRSLKGVESVTRVLCVNQATAVYAGNSATKIELLGIDPSDFAKTVRYRSDMNPYSLNYYMNALISNPSGVLLSERLRKTLGVDAGDIIQVSYGNGYFEGVVSGFFEYFPGYEPGYTDEYGDYHAQEMIVGSLAYLFSGNPVQPYEIWVRRNPGAADRTVYDSIAKNRIKLKNAVSAEQQVIEAKNDPELQGTNGMLSLGFLISMTVCTIGFFIYWFLSLGKRKLQFGVMRAVGMSQKRIYAMLWIEQIFLSGSSILAGYGVGCLSSRLYVPLFELSYWKPNEPVPFAVISYPEDMLKVFAALAVMLLVCSLFLARSIRRNRICDALKLGED